MDIIRDIEIVKPLKDTVVTVGTFDGVHLGHQQIISRLMDSAKDQHFRSVLVTFDPHPKEVIILEGKPPIKILSTMDEKLEILANMGVDTVVAIPFTKAFSMTSPEDFIKEILCGKLGMRSIVVGYDHNFGRDRKGDISTLQDIGEEYGFTVETVGPYRVNDIPINSTLIRNSLLDNGDVAIAAEYLGRHYSLSGQVVRGRGEGKKLNFPTANIEIQNDNKLVPYNGVYCVSVELDGKRFDGMMNIGLRPTFNGDTRTVEVHLISDEEYDLYNRELRIEFIYRIRDEFRFNSPEELRAQLNEDRMICLNS